MSLTSPLDVVARADRREPANVAASTEAVTAARAQLQLAEARYAQGLGSQIELADAQTAVTTAEGNLYPRRVAARDRVGTLRRALGQI